MNALLWTVKLLFLFIVLTFALKNTDVVPVRYYLGLQWHAPLIVVILVAFFLGAVAGVFASLGRIVCMRRDISRLRKKTDSANAAESVTSQRISDAL